jgi:hypothetical protein
MEESALANGIGLPYTGDWFGNPIFLPRVSPTRDTTPAEDVVNRERDCGETSFDLSPTEMEPINFSPEPRGVSSTSPTLTESTNPFDPLEADTVVNDSSIRDSYQAPETPALSSHSTDNIPETIVEAPKTSMDTIRPSDFRADNDSSRSSSPQFDEEFFLGMPAPVIVVEQGSEISILPLHEIVPDGLRTPSSPGLDPQILVDEIHPPSPGDILPASIMSPTTPERLSSPPHSNTLIFTSEVDVTKHPPFGNPLKEDAVENGPDPGEEASLPHLGSMDAKATDMDGVGLEASVRDSFGNEDAQHQDDLIEDDLIRDALPQNDSSKLQRPTPTRLQMPVRARPSGPRVPKVVGGKESSIHAFDHVFQSTSAAVTEETSRQPNSIIDDKPSFTEAGGYLITESPDRRLPELPIELSFPVDPGLSPVRETENELPSPESYKLRTPSWGSSCATPTRPLSTYEVAEAHVYTPVTSRAFPVFLPPEKQQEPEEDGDNETEDTFGHATIIKKPFPPPETPTDLNGSATPTPVIFKAVVHKKVTELPAIAAGSRDSFYKSLTPRAQRGTKTESVLRNPGYGELVTLLQETAMLEKTLSEGHVPSDEPENDGHYISSPSLLLSTTSGNQLSPALTEEKSLPSIPSPKSSQTSRYLSTLRRLKNTASVMRSMPGHGYKTSPSRSASISSEVSLSDSTTNFSQCDNGIYFPTSTSSSPRRKGLNRAVSFADRLLQRVRTKSSVSEIHGT